LELIKEERGQHFDPAVVDAMLDCLPEILKIRDEFAEPDEPT